MYTRADCHNCQNRVIAKIAARVNENFGNYGNAGDFGNLKKMILSIIISSPFPQLPRDSALRAESRRYMLPPGSFQSETMAKLFEPPRYIALEGPIRVGKSTLANVIADRMNAQRIIEPEDNPFLGAFYEGQRGAAFQAQFAFLVRRFEQLQRLEVGPQSHKTVVADYIFEKDKIFACINLTDTELEIYNRYYHHFREQLPVPDLVIYLQASPEVLKKRLRKKNVPGETAVSDDYIEEVAKAYEHFFFHYTASDLLVVNTNDIDFVERHADLQELLRRVSEPIRGTQYFLPLGSSDAASA
jgi:deoxyadenosine/deoxycytidine kinase